MRKVFVHAAVNEAGLHPVPFQLVAVVDDHIVIAGVPLGLGGHVGVGLQQSFIQPALLGECLPGRLHLRIILRGKGVDGVEKQLQPGGRQGCVQPFLLGDDLIALFRQELRPVILLFPGELEVLGASILPGHLVVIALIPHDLRTNPEIVGVPAAVGDLAGLTVDVHAVVAHQVVFVILRVEVDVAHGGVPDLPLGGIPGAVVLLTGEEGRVEAHAVQLGIGGAVSVLNSLAGDGESLVQGDFPVGWFAVIANFIGGGVHAFIRLLPDLLHRQSYSEGGHGEQHQHDGDDRAGGKFLHAGCFLSVGGGQDALGQVGVLPQGCAMHVHRPVDFLPDHLVLHWRPSFRAAGDSSSSVSRVFSLSLA